MYLNLQTFCRSLLIPFPGSSNSTCNSTIKRPCEWRIWAFVSHLRVTCKSYFGEPTEGCWWSERAVHLKQFPRKCADERGRIPQAEDKVDQLLREYVSKSLILQQHTMRCSWQRQCKNLWRTCKAALTTRLGKVIEFADSVKFILTRVPCSLWKSWKIVCYMGTMPVLHCIC